ncbi:MAG: heavy-metal-associated domain-containing protein [Bacteroidota bacterium]|nr:heavy-metal-associated domain-containing protein [Bacteroidota bacterium]
MKAYIIIIAFLFGAIGLQAQKTEKEKFKVYGKCEMCEERIEKAAEALDGVQSADWDILSKKIKVKYDPEKVKLIEIHEAIAKVGHDTEKVRADDETYGKLHHCCHYERKEKEY